MSTAQTRSLPHNLDAEKSVLGGILLHPKSFTQVAELLLASDFYSPPHVAIYEAMVALDRKGRGIDALTVADEMRAAETFDKLRAFDGDAYFLDLTSAVITIENIRFHAGIVAGKAKVRRIVEAMEEHASKGRGEHGDVEEFADSAERAIFEATRSREVSTYVLTSKILGAVVKQVEAAYERKQSITGVPSGYARIDAMTAGFQPSELIVIAARPSMGKTALAMNMAYSAALDHQVPVLVFSLEMSDEALVTRAVCAEARIDSARLKGGFLDQHDWVNLTKAASRISEAQVWIDDKASPTLLEIRAKARRWRADPAIFQSPTQLGMIVIDYLQLIAPPPTDRPGNRNREQEVAEMSRGLKALAKELRLPVLALSQLNRAVESRRDKRPVLSDLRESGAIEQDADVIAFIYRDEVYDKASTDKGTAEIIFGKQRNNPIGTVRLAYLSQYTRFENLSTRDE